FDEELDAPIKDQPLPTDALPTALLPGYIDDSNPEEDEEDLEEDPIDYPANRGDNNENESSNDDDDDDDFEKDEENDEKEEHLSPIDPSVEKDTEAFETNESASTPPTSPHHIILFFWRPNPEMMTTINQGMSVEEIERVVAQRVANAIEAISIYETKTNLARKSMSQTKRQKEKVEENASNKRN
nr:hypothetical protein [Tanacetum cinerariifolium]